jgi:aldehyde dehydrogenase (NAD+)
MSTKAGLFGAEIGPNLLIGALGGKLKGMPLSPAQLHVLWDRQKQAFLTEGPPSLAQRKQQLVRLQASIEKWRGRLCEALHADFRKPAFEVELTEIDPCLSEIKHTLKHLETWMKPERVPTPKTLFGACSEIWRQPKGCVLILSPWNYPVNLSLAPLIAALAAGNRVVLRPSSEKVPATAKALEALITETFDPWEVACVNGGVELAEALTDLPFDHIFFTGSTRVGKHIQAKAAKHLASVTLELGGKSPAIVDVDSDVEEAARRLAWGKNLNAGQTCVAPDHVWVPSGMRSRFVQAYTQAVETLYGASDEARQASPDLARIVDAAAFERLKKLYDDSVLEGATPALGGLFDASERYVAPTLLIDVTPESPCMLQEIFGPILPVLEYTTLDEPVRWVTSGPKPLALYVFSQSRARTDWVLAHAPSGGAVVNNSVLHLANPDLPFGGTGASGQGAYHGEHGFRELSHSRAVLRQGAINPIRYFMAPYAQIPAWMKRLKDV